ncbi:hypothetical protein F5883DRAFT_584371 [Diaporthe sp. PMI_573]|nr:hypothetical protein F5883DRAFT_584371 [Diaporthaceae sp. PMI_573]
MSSTRELRFAYARDWIQRDIICCWRDYIRPNTLNSGIISTKSCGTAMRYAKGASQKLTMFSFEYSSRMKEFVVFMTTEIHDTFAGRLAELLILKLKGSERVWANSSLEQAVQRLGIESVITERISYLVKTFGLLPTNHFGARNWQPLHSQTAG